MIASPPTVPAAPSPTVSLNEKCAALEAELKALRSRERELTSFVESATIGLHWVDAEGRLLWANQAELDLLGYAPEEYVGHHISEFHADAPVIGDILTRLCRGEKLREYEARLRCKDGSLRTVLIDSSVLWDNGRFVHTQCFTRDVTAQREAEARMQHLAAIVAGSDDAILSKSLNGVITSWNPGAERVLGYKAEEVVGKSVTMLVPEDRWPEEERILGRLRAGERFDHYETVRRHKDGRLIDVSLTISPVLDRRGAIIGVSTIARDITEQKASADALQKARDELERINGLLEERVRERTASLMDLLTQMESFSYTVSHDLRAPIRAVQGYARILQAEYAPKLEGDGAYYVDRIIRSCDRMNRLIADLLAYAALNRARVDPQPLSLSATARQLIRQSPELQSPHATINVQSSGPLVLGNETFLTQVFANLLGNAVKFVPQGTHPKITVSFRREGDRVRTEVTDNGIGIKPEHQARLFGLFERLATDQVYEGTGIGLAIVRRAVERMGGAVGLVSDGGKGSTFWFTLPAAPAGQAASQTAAE